MSGVFRPAWRPLPRRPRYLPSLTPAASGSAPDAPTGLAFTDAHDARVTITFTAALGYRVLYRAGTSVIAPSGPTDAAWTLATEATGAFTGTLDVVLPGNGDYAVAVYGYDGLTYSASAPVVATVAMSAPYVAGAFDTYAVLVITDDHAGFPVLEVDERSDYAKGTGAVFYDGAGVDRSHFAVFESSDSLGDALGTTATGTPLGPDGFPAGSSGLVIRATYPSIPGTRYARASQAVRI